MLKEYNPSAVFVFFMGFVICCLCLVVVNKSVTDVSISSYGKYKRWFWVNRELVPGKEYAYEWVRSSPETGTITVIWFDGSHRAVPVEWDGGIFYHSGYTRGVPWEREINTPDHLVTGFIDHGSMKRYYIKLARFVHDYPVPSYLAAIILTLGAAFASGLVLADTARPGSVFSTSLGALVVIGGAFYLVLLATSSYGEDILWWFDWAHARGAHLKSRMNPEGYLLPVTPGELFDARGPSVTADLYYGPAFLLFHPLLVLGAFGTAYVLPGMPQWLHYVFVPHPASRAVNRATRRPGHRPLDARDMLGEMRRRTPHEPPPPYVSENMRRKAAEHARRLREDTELMRRAVERERMRQEFEDTRRR